MDSNPSMNQNLLIIQTLLSHAGEFPSLLGTSWPLFNHNLQALLKRLIRAENEDQLSAIVDDLLSLLSKTPLMPLVRDALKPLLSESTRAGGRESTRGAAGETGDQVLLPPVSQADVIDMSVKLIDVISAPEQRHFNTLFTLPGAAAAIPPDQPLVYTQVYDLYVDISPERKGLGADDASFPDVALKELWHGQDTLPLTVWVASRDFEIHPQIQTLHLPPHGPSEGIRSVVRPIIREGRGHIQVESFYQGHLIQSKRVEALVMPAAGMPVPDSLRPAQTARTTFTTQARLEPDSIAQFPERVLTINVERDPRDGSLDIRFLDRTADDRAVAQYDNHLQPEALGKAIGDVRRLLFQTVSGVKNGETTQGYQWILEAQYDLLNVWLPRLANAGRSLYRALLPRDGMQPPAEDQGERLKAALQPGAVIQVNPVSGHSTIPWSVLYERELKYVLNKTPVCRNFVSCGQDCAGCPSANDFGVVCPYAFWGYRYAIEQLPCWVNGEMSQLPTLVRQVANAQPLVLNLNVWRGFSQWAEHKTRIEAAGNVQVLVAEEISQLEKVWQSRNADLDLVYFYCHGGNDAEIGPYVELSDGLIGSNFLDAVKPSWGHAPLVYLNGCSTGDYGPDSYLSLIDDFRAAGASGVIGSECPVPEIFAEAYASALLSRLFRGERLGQAMLEERLAFLRKNFNPLGLAYSLYAANEIALLQPVSKTQLHEESK